jgi:hypothetical protein
MPLGVSLRNILYLTVDDASHATTIQASEHPKAGAKVSFTLTVTVSNTGAMDGDVTLFVTYSKQTDGVMRWVWCAPLPWILPC